MNEESNLNIENKVNSTILTMTQNNIAKSTITNNVNLNNSNSNYIENIQKKSAPVLLIPNNNILNNINNNDNNNQNQNINLIQIGNRSKSSCSSKDSILNLIINNNHKSKSDICQNNDIKLKELRLFYKNIKELVMPKNIKNNESIEDNFLIVIEEVKNMVKKIKELEDEIKELKNSKYKNINNNIQENEKIEETKVTQDKSFYNLINSNIFENKINDNNKVDNIINSVNFIPEAISPENNYKIFIYSARQFKYEENIYNKYITKEDIKILKSFNENLKKYLENFYENSLKHKNKHHLNSNNHKKIK